MAANIEAVTGFVKEYTDDVRQRISVKRVVLLGSYVKGTASELSDVDACFFLDSFNGKQHVDVIVDLLSIAGEKSTGVFF